MAVPLVLKRVETAVACHCRIFLRLEGPKIQVWYGNVTWVVEMTCIVNAPPFLSDNSFLMSLLGRFPLVVDIERHMPSGLVMKSLFRVHFRHMARRDKDVNNYKRLTMEDSLPRVNDGGYAQPRFLGVGLRLHAFGRLNNQCCSEVDCIYTMRKPLLNIGTE